MLARAPGVRWLAVLVSHARRLLPSAKVGAERQIWRCVARRGKANPPIAWGGAGTAFGQERRAGLISGADQARAAVWSGRQVPGARRHLGRFEGGPGLEVLTPGPPSDMN